MKRILYTIILVTSILSTTAQTLRSSYFLERMPYRHINNPALINDYGYISIPVIGNISVTTNSNIGLSNFLFPHNGEIVTGLHPDIDSNQFLSGLKNNNNFSTTEYITILSAGFFAFNGYNTVGLNIRSDSDVNFPKDIFTFLKNGQTSDITSYNFGNVRAKSNNYAELAFGHARRYLDNKLSVGAKAKLLLGLGNVDARIDHMEINMTGDKWIINSRGTANLSLSGASLEKDENGDINKINYELRDFKLSGYGASFDLGASYKINENINVSLAVLDLGFISWNSNKFAQTRSEGYVFEGFHTLASEDDENGHNDFDDEKDEVVDELKALIKFDEIDGRNTRTTALKATVNAGAEYSILKNKISFGLLSTTQFGTSKVWTELMAVANFRPAKWFECALNGSVSNYGCSWGALINFCPRRFNFFIGADYIATSYTPQFIPVNRAKLGLNFGINIPLGMDPLYKN